MLLSDVEEEVPLQVEHICPAAEGGDMPVNAQDVDPFVGLNVEVVTAQGEHFLFQDDGCRILGGVLGEDT